MIDFLARFGPHPHGPHRFRWAEEEWFGPPAFGPFRHKGPGRGPGRKGFLERGDLKYVILDLLVEQPRHGYDIIRALEDRFGGFYSPSPGVIYPTLQLLEDQGAISGREQDGKRIYAITEAGRTVLAERVDVLDGLRERMRGWGPGQRPELAELRHELERLGRSLFSPDARGWWSDPERVRRVSAILARTRTELEAVLRAGPHQPETL